MKRLFQECDDWDDENHLPKIKKKKPQKKLSLDEEHEPGKFVRINKGIDEDNLVISVKKKKNKRVKKKTNNGFDENSGKLISFEPKLHSPLPPASLSNTCKIISDKNSTISEKNKKKNKSSVSGESANNLCTLKIELQTPSTTASADSTKKDKKKKNNKKKETVYTPNKINECVPAKLEPQTSTASSGLASKLRKSLKGSRFRFINEQLYTTDGNSAIKIFKNDPEAFRAYHEGYRHQVELWPKNPLDRIIKAVRKMPKHFIIGDFGCGEARLSRSVKQKVYSIDLVSSSKDVIASDMANTPLESQYLDVAVYCLSLMGVNLKDFFIEANRVLKMGGLIKIAEIASRFEKLNEFIYNVEKCGFKLLKKDSLQDLFCFLDFKKVGNISKSDSTLRQFSLKPCLYKKR